MLTYADVCCSCRLADSLLRHPARNHLGVFARQGTQFTGFTSTKAPSLTPEEPSSLTSVGALLTSQFTFFTSTKVPILTSEEGFSLPVEPYSDLSLLSLLVQKYQS